MCVCDSQMHVCVMAKCVCVCLCVCVPAPSQDCLPLGSQRARQGRHRRREGRPPTPRGPCALLSGERRREGARKGRRGERKEGDEKGRERDGVESEECEGRDGGRKNEGTAIHSAHHRSTTAAVGLYSLGSVVASTSRTRRGRERGGAEGTWISLVTRHPPSLPYSSLILSSSLCYAILSYPVLFLLCSALTSQPHECPAHTDVKLPVQPAVPDIVRLDTVHYNAVRCSIVG